MTHLNIYINNALADSAFNEEKEFEIISGFEQYYRHGSLSSPHVSR